MNTLAKIFKPIKRKRKGRPTGLNKAGYWKGKCHPFEKRNTELIKGNKK